MINYYDLQKWDLGYFSVGNYDLQDINNSVDWMLASMSLEGLLDEEAQFIVMMRTIGRNEESNDSLKAAEKQIVKNYFLVRGIRTRNASEVEMAIACGAQINKVCMYQGTRYTPIVCAARFGNLEIVKKLVNAGADVNQTQMNGEGALANAANNDNYEVAEYLLEKGADPNKIAYQGITPLAVAESSRMIKLLLAYGADPNIPDCDGDLPIIARIDNHDYESAKLLIDAGCDIDHQNKSGISARSRGRRSYDPRIQHLFQ